MKDKLKELLNTLYEAEGLVEMALRRFDTSGKEIAVLAVDKCFQVADMAASLNLPQEDKGVPDNESKDENLPVYAALENEDTSVAGTEDDFASQSQYDEDDKQVVDLFTNEILPAMEADDKLTLEEPDDEEAVPAQEALYEPDIEDSLADINDASAFDTEQASETNMENVRNFDASEDSQKDMAEGQETVAVTKENPAKALSPVKEVNWQDSIDMDKKLQRKPAISFFSLNDKFRFRRELFSNSEAAFRDSLSLLETMSDLSEAYDYFYTDLGWDPESEDVKAFIAITERYFKS